MGLTRNSILDGMVGTDRGALVNVGVRAGAGVDAEVGVGVKVRSNG